MTLPASGAISMSQVNTELGASTTTTRGLGDSAVRTLAGVSSGAISFSNLYGKSSFTPTNPLPNNGGSYSDSMDGTDDMDIVVKTNGQLIITGTSGVQGLSSGWGTPQPTTGIGNSYYVKFTPTSGSLSSNGATSFTQISADRTCYVRSVGTTSAAGAIKTCTVRVDIATDSGGTNIVATGTYTISAHGLRII